MITKNVSRVLLPFLSAALACSALAVDPPPGGGYPNENTALGTDALFSLVPNTLGQNTALGYNAMFHTLTGTENVAVGDQTLFSNTVGTGNIAMGYQALYSNLDGLSNVGIGVDALFSNTTGYCNVAIGCSTLVFNNSFFNTAIGDYALNTNTTGDANTAVGAKALAINDNASDNTAVGYGALNYNSGSSKNVAIGSFAGPAYGFSGSNNILLGFAAGSGLNNGSNNIMIGNNGAKGDAGVIRIGDVATQTKAFVAGVAAAPLATGTALAVGVTSTGQLGVRASSARFKEAIAPMEGASEVLLALKPVTFRYRKELDPSATPQFGLVAEEVAKVDPDLVARDASGKPFTVRYEEVNAMLLNEFLKEHRKVEAQGNEIAQLKAMLQKQAAQLQKVSERLEGSAPAPF